MSIHKNDLTLANWNPRKEKIPFSIMAIASRGSGKSTLIKYLYQKYWSTQFDSVIVFCDSYDEMEEYQSYLPGNLFYTEYKAGILTKLMEIQKKRILDDKPKLNVLLIFDDCSDDGEKHSKEIQKIYTKGRHVYISVIFATQATTLTGTVWRQNSTIIIGRQQGGLGRKQVYENFLNGMAEDEDIPENISEKTYYRRLLKKYTENHYFMVLSFASNLNDFKNTVFKYKAQIEQNSKEKKKNAETKKIETTAEITQTELNEE